jgi:hypothetical protein
MLATISVSHLYNLRHSQGYQKQRRHFTKTQSRQVPIGERRKPQPNGETGQGGIILCLIFDLTVFPL